jgi:hypothetical protein
MAVYTCEDCEFYRLIDGTPVCVRYPQADYPHEWSEHGWPVIRWPTDEPCGEFKKS